MTSWPATVEPAACRRWLAAGIALHAGAAVVPWLAGCSPPVAVALAALALAGLPATLRAIPGGLAAIRRLQLEGDTLTLTLRNGATVPGRLLPASRAWRDAVLLRVGWAGGAASLWLPRTALPPPAFRRLKVRVRIGR